MSDQDSHLPEPPLDGELAACCIETMRLHGTHNMMMMCPTCKTVIKCFLDERAFRAYYKFCLSRHRKIRTIRKDELLIVTFSSYETIR